MRICAVGDNVVDRYVDRGVMYPGGNAVNVAVHARRLGAETSYVGVLGTDSAGDLLAASLGEEGVDLARTRRVPGENAYAVVRVVDGDRVFDVGSLGVSEIVLDSADLDYVGGFDLVHTGDCSGTESQLHLLAGRAPVSFDFSSQPRSYAEPLLPYVRIATFSVVDGSGEELDQLFAWAHDAGPEYVIATLGSRGAVISDGSATFAHDAVPSTVVDTLGAGDAFIARACVGLLNGERPQDVVRDASVYAAQTCQSFGAFGHESPDNLPPWSSAPADTELQSPVLGI